VHGRDAQALAAVHGEIERDGGRAIRVGADVTSYAEIETMRLRIERELGPIDILVANAGGHVPDHQERPDMDLIPDSLRQSLVEQHPIRRLGTPEDVAAAALLVVFEDSWITGVILDVAGGAQ
jgi:NAD(P)-dependent dehydrogenase (short-subunit alcohol dehydrogenase family)